MSKLDRIAADALRDRLAETDDPKAVRRLMIALAYKDGESVETLSERYGTPKSTIYYWLDRFESRSMEAALEDDSRPGRPRRLTDGERRSLARDIEGSPENRGYEAAEWSPGLVRRHITAAYGVEYSLGHVRRLLREEFEPVYE